MWQPVERELELIREICDRGGAAQIATGVEALLRLLRRGQVEQFRHAVASGSVWGHMGSLFDGGPVGREANIAFSAAQIRLADALAQAGVESNDIDHHVVSLRIRVPNEAPFAVDADLLRAGGWDARYARVLAKWFVEGNAVTVLFDTNGRRVGDRPYEYVELVYRDQEGRLRSSGATAGSRGSGWSDQGVAYVYGRESGDHVYVDLGNFRSMSVPVQHAGWWIFALRSAEPRWRDGPSRF